MLFIGKCFRSVSLPLPCSLRLFSWWLSRKPPEPEGIAILDDRQRLWMAINHLVVAWIFGRKGGMLTVLRVHLLVMGTQLGRELTE